MKKIIAAFDGLKFSESAKDYAIELAKQSNAYLVGVFLDDPSYTSYKIYDLVSKQGGIIGSAKRKLNKKDAKKRASAVANFEAACQKADLVYTIHRDRNIAIKELLHESIYADLLIVDSFETLSHYTERTPTHFIRDLLTEVQCPVLVVPHSFNAIRKLILLYDGEPSSMHAIKMLSYTLASLKQNPIEVLTVRSAKHSQSVRDNTLMKEFMKRHFPKAGYIVLKGLPETEIVKYLKQEKDSSLIVLGAYQRSMVSRWSSKYG